jgi:glutathione reductase (NADPH)
VVPDIELLELTKTKKGIKVIYTQAGETHKFTVDAVLCAIGRSPNLTGLGLEHAGVALKTTGRFPAIAVDEWSRTNQPHIFAVGDCTDRVNLTPVAIAEGRAFADTEFGHQPRTVNHENIASAVFSQPEAASVGLSQAQAEARYGVENIKIYRSQFRPMYHSFTGQPAQVMVKLVVAANSEKILGVHMVGDQAAEIIQGMAIAVKMGATKRDFDATIGIHPSTAEEFVTLR